MGYSVDASDSLIGYIAYNPDAYKINLSFAGSRLSISLDAPLELNPITWPTSGVGALLPVPESLLAKVTENTSDSYRVVIGNSSLQVFNSYVSLCQDNGFNVDYYSKDNKYEAKNSEGFRLNVAYLGCNQMEIMILSPKEDSSVVVSSSKNNSSSEKPSNSIFSKEFKEAMDSYEAFMDEYVSFMKKYKNSNGTDTTLITDYANYMTCYTQVVSDFSKWRSEELNTEEAKYYIEVQARVAQKLLDVAS